MSSTNKTETTQSSQTNPYGPAIPLLANEASQVGGMSTEVTPEQQQALGELWGESQGIPNLVAPTTTAITNSLGASTSPWQGMLNDSVNAYKANVNPIATGSTNPYDTPGFSDALATSDEDIKKQLESVYAGSGRDPTGSGGFMQQLARGLAQGNAPAIVSQFNSNVGNKLAANNGEANVWQNASSTGSNEELAALQQQLAGINGVGMLPGIVTAPGQAAVSTANTAYGQPWNNISPAIAATEGIGAMGGTASGQGETTQQTSALGNVLGLLTGGAGIVGAIAKSDARIKENIHPVGKLADGQTVHAFNFKDDPKKTPVIGLLAQEVERVRPDAVHTIGGIKHVDYRKATENARRRVGMLQVAA